MVINVTAYYDELQHHILYMGKFWRGKILVNGLCVCIVTTDYEREVIGR